MAALHPMFSTDVGRRPIACHHLSDRKIAARPFPETFVMDGFYVAYLAGRSGTSMVLFAIRERMFVGADIGGLKYDGEITPAQEGFKCTVVYIIPAGATLITGSPPPEAEQRIPLEFTLPKDFWNGQVIGIATPLGPINAKFQKLRDW